MGRRSLRAQKLKSARNGSAVDAGQKPPPRKGAVERSFVMSGYSGTPLWKKLGIEPGSRLCVTNAPRDYEAWVAPLPDGAAIHSAGSKGDCDIVHIFVDSVAALEYDLKKARAWIHSAGAIWVSWPKKSAGIVTDLDENRIRSIALRTDLVDVKVCAVSEVWSGLKLVVRKHLR